MKLLLVLLCCASVGAIRYDPNFKTIGTAIKGGQLVRGVEQTLFEYTGNGTITEQWFTGKGVMDENARIRIYVDGETENPSLDFMLFLAHGIGTDSKTEKPNTPWATPRIAHTNDGSIYNTIRIPFGSSLKITAQNDVAGGAFWYIVRGVTNYPVVVGEVELPSSARLKLYKIVDYPTQPLDFVTVVNTSSTASGVLLSFTMKAVSADFNFLEACFRAYIDGADEPLFLSSGTEDYFLSSYYFETGLYHEENSGCTALLNDYIPPPPPPSGDPDYENYFLSPQDGSCTEACENVGLVCNPEMYLGADGGLKMMQYLKINGCVVDPDPWWAPDQPNYVSGKFLPDGSPEQNYNKCVGFTGYPSVSQCDARYPTVKRVCHCYPTGPTPPPPPAMKLVGAYKFFENDPVFFKNGFKLVWRNMEEGGGIKTGCPSTWPPNVGSSLSHIEELIAMQNDRNSNNGKLRVGPATYTTYAWVYEW